MSKKLKSETPVAAATTCSRLITQAELENVLTHEGIVEHDAIEDPFGYDNGKTELAVSVAARILDEIARGKLKACSLLAIRWRHKAADLYIQAGRMGTGFSELPTLWRAVGNALEDCAKELEEMSCPAGSRKTSVDDDRASSPSYNGHTRCKKCGQVHWMHGECNSSENDKSLLP